MGKRTTIKNMAKKEKETIPAVSNKLSEFEIHEISYNMQSMDLDIDKLVIQLDELSEVKWFSMEKLKRMVETGELNRDQIEFFNKCLEFLNK